MRRLILLLLLLAWGSGTLLAQHVEPADSARSSRADSTAAPKTVAEPLRSLQFLPRSTIRYSLEDLNEIYHESVPELFDLWPGMRIARRGDTGYPDEAQFGGEPPRFLRVEIDAIPWPKGIYGQINLTALPETALDDVRIDPAGGSLRFFSAPSHTSTTWTHFEYVDGPFGSDALRARLRRPLSSRLSFGWSAAFASSDGQIRPQGLQGSAFESTKFFLKTDYLLSRKRSLYLQHHFLKSVNENVDAAVTFPEEWPQVSINRYKDSRFGHVLTFAKRSPWLEKGTTRRLDRWQIAAEYWDLREEFRDDPLQRRLQHKQRLFGWRAAVNFVRGPLFGGVRVAHRIHDWRDSSIVTPQTQVFEAEWFGILQSASGRRLQLHLRPRRHSRFGWQMEGEFRLQTVLGPKGGLFVAAGRKAEFPHVGEYALTVPQVVQPNLALSPMTVDFSRIGGNWRGKALALQAWVSYIRLRRPVALERADSIWQFQNLPDAATYGAWETRLSWRPKQRLALEIEGSGLTSLPANGYLFAHLPQHKLRMQIETGAALFSGDLPTSLVLRSTYYGKRRNSPLEVQLGPGRKEEGGFWKVDVLARLHFRDAVIFLDFENLLDVNAEWRPQQPLRGRHFRLGVNWILLD